MPEKAGWMPVSSTTVRPLYLTTQHERPTSCPAPSICTSISSTSCALQEPRGGSVSSCKRARERARGTHARDAGGRDDGVRRAKHARCCALAHPLPPLLVRRARCWSTTDAHASDAAREQRQGARAPAAALVVTFDSLSLTQLAPLGRSLAALELDLPARQTTWHRVLQLQLQLQEQQSKLQSSARSSLSLRSRQRRRPRQVAS